VGVRRRPPRIGFGVYSVTGFYGEFTVEEAVALLREAYAAGIRFFDTGDVYGYGLGEELLCKAFTRGELEEIYIATKIGYDFYSSRPPVRRFDPRYLLEAARRSVGRLCRPPDLLQLHNPPLEALGSPETWEALERIVEEGLAASVGVALGPETDVLEEGLEALGRGEVEAIQFVYNILEQEPGFHLASLAASRGVTPIARVPHAGGVLSEDVVEEEPRLRDHRGLRRRGWYRWALRVYRGRVKPLLDPLPGTPWQKALRFIFDTLPGASVVVTATSPGRLWETVEALRLPPLPPRVLAGLRRAHLEEVAGSSEKPARSLALLGLAGLHGLQPAAAGDA